MSSSNPIPPPPPPRKGKTSLGIDENLEALLTYVLGWITGLIFLLLEKESRFVKFHALQSLITFLGLHIVTIFIGMFPFIGWGLFRFIGWAISSILALIALILWIVCMIKAYQGEWFKLPIVGEIAEKNIK